MPTTTYIPLANITLGSSAASVTFSSISQAYRDLVLVINAKSTTSPNAVLGIINSDTGSNYNRVAMGGNGTNAGSSSNSNQTAMSLFFYTRVETVDGFMATLNFQDYSATDKQKSVLARLDNANIGTDAMAHRWASTAAITNLQFNSSSGSFVAGTSFALYGIAA